MRDYNPSKRTCNLFELSDLIGQKNLHSMLWTNPLEETITIDVWEDQITKSNMAWLFGALSLYKYEIVKVDFKTSEHSFYMTFVIAKRKER